MMLSPWRRYAEPPLSNQVPLFNCLFVLLTRRKSRRERNRMAQKRFQARKNAVSTAQEQRIHQLEETIERMSGIVQDFASDFARSTTATADLPLTAKLRDSLTSLISLTKEETVVSSSPPPWVHAEPMTDVFGGKRPTSPSTSPPTSDPPYPAISPHLSPNANIFGNGWTGYLPSQRPNTPSAAYGRLNPKETSANSVGARLLHYTLQRAYHCLLEATDCSYGRVQSTFGKVLEYKSKTEILFTMRWCLGGGEAEMSRLAGTVFRGQTFSSPQSSRHDAPEESEDYLNANQVSSYLADKAISFSGTDGITSPFPVPTNLLPLELEAHQVVPVPVPTSRSSSRRLGWNPGLLFDNGSFDTQPHANLLTPTATPESSSITPTAGAQQSCIPQSTLFFYLSEISLCLGTAPGYRRAYLDAAISASIAASQLQPQPL